MEVLQIVGIGVIGAVIVLILRELRPDMALAASLATGGLIALSVIGKLSGVMEVMSNLSERARLSAGYLSTMIRVIGVAYLAEFGSQVCRDAGAGSIAAKVELGGKLIILAMAAPVVASVVDLVVGVLR